MELESIVKLFKKFGYIPVIVSAVVLVAIKFSPQFLDEYSLKRFNSVYAVYGADENNDIRIYSIFRTEGEAERYRSNISDLVSKETIIIVSEWKFDRKIPGLEAYNPYRKQYLEDSRKQQNNKIQDVEYFRQIVSIDPSVTRAQKPRRKFGYEELESLENRTRIISISINDYEIATSWIEKK